MNKYPSPIGVKNDKWGYMGAQVRLPTILGYENVIRRFQTRVRFCRIKTTYI